MTVITFHEISEQSHRILNPFSDEKLRLLGEVCQPRKAARHLDLACGKGEMLCQWAVRYGITGIGVDISRVFVEAARARAGELDIESNVSFVEHDAASFRADENSFDVVSCIGATWIGGGLRGTLALMKTMLNFKGLLLVGEPYWKEIPPAGADIMAADPNQFASLVGTMDRFEAEGTELVEMVLSDPDNWDRYQASQWLNVSRWLDANAEHPDAATVRGTRDEWRRAYLEYGRQRWGWGVFVLRVR